MDSTRQHMQKTIYLILLILGFSGSTYGQICDGNLGENIFTEGDFGSGTANILSPDPQIAPGYTYEFDPPPNDGTYTITNNTTNWGWFAANSWDDIGDNSSDPNGYMMVVNASYDPGLFYRQQVDGLCENTLYVFSADVYNLILDLGKIRPNLSFLIDGVVVFGTGDIPENKQWNTYGFTFTTAPGQTSVILALQNNAPGGSGNDLALDNITFRPCGPEALILPEAVANICEDGSPIDLEATIIGTQYATPAVQWQQSFDGGLTWVNIPGAMGTSVAHTDLSAGLYLYRYLLANGPENLSNSKCRVVSNVKLVNVVPKFYTITDTLCTGSSFLLGNTSYSQTGVYVENLLTTLGCDSIVTLNLTILPDADIQADFTVANPSCNYLQDGSIALTTIFNGTEPYTIYIDGELSTTGNLNNLPEGEYTYQITDKFGCSLDTVIRLQTPQPFQVDIGPDRELELGEWLNIIPTLSDPAELYLWETGDSLICDTDCAILNWAPGVSTTVSLEATSLSGCLASDSMKVEVVNVRRVYMPSAFSPNGDGHNEYFTVFGSIPNVLQIDQMRIFNRWGNVVFENANFSPNEPSSGWDGTYKGKTIPEGVYVYVAHVRFLDGVTTLMTGSVSLIR